MIDLYSVWSNTMTKINLKNININQSIELPYDKY